MSETRQMSRCAQSETLVLIEAMPLCRIDPREAAQLAALIATAPQAPATSCAGLPARCAAVMPCDQALALVEGVGHVVF